MAHLPPQEIQYDESEDTYHELKQFAKILRVRTKRDWDVVCAFTGEEGSGKSCGAIQLAKLSDKNFSITQNEIIGINVKDIQDKMINLKPGAAIIADEAIKILYKQNWANKGQRFINILFTLARKENKITLLCIPRFRDLNEYFRNHRVKFWIHVIARGVGIVFVRDWSPFAKDPWWMDENQKIIDNALKSKRIHDINVELKMKILSRSKNFLTVIKFPDFTDEEREEYQQIIAPSKYEGAIESDDNIGAFAQRYKERFARIAFELIKRGMTLKQIERATGSPRSTLSSGLNSLPEYKSHLSNKKQLESNFNSPIKRTKTLKGVVGWRQNG